MEESGDHVEELIKSLSESLSVEVKGWIDPSSDEGAAKIAKTSIALRNYNGGFLVVGFDDATLSPIFDDAPSNPEERFHKDVVQGLVTRYASESFEVEVYTPELQGQKFPVIRVSAGVRVPVAAKSDLKDQNGKFLVKANSVYVRSLRSNNTPSTTEAGWKDWGDLVEVCFENREADIGRFLRRHLGGMGREELLEALGKGGGEPKGESLSEASKQYLDFGLERLNSALADRGEFKPQEGSWEVSLVFEGELRDFRPDRSFLNLLNSTNPDYTGWPLWLDGRPFGELDQPYVYQEAWENLIILVEGQAPFSHFDFYRMEPRGKFYSWRVLEDDFSKSPNRPAAGTCLDFVLPILRVSEAIAVGLAFGKALFENPEEGRLGFSFRWRGMKGRKLCSWANPGRMLRPSKEAKQDEVLSSVEVPADTPNSAITPYVYQAVSPLIEIFGGFSMGEEGYQEFVDNLVNRKL